MIISIYTIAKSATNSSYILAPLTSTFSDLSLLLVPVLAAIRALLPFAYVDLAPVENGLELNQQRERENAHFSTLQFIFFSAIFFDN